MSHCMRSILGLAAGGLILVGASAQPAAAQPGATFRPGVPSVQVRPGVPAVQVRPGVPAVQARPNPQPLTRPTVNLQFNPTRPIGGDWWRTYPWSPYNAWRNPYWYPPYNNNYPFPPNGAYPYNPYVVPQPYPVPLPWGGIGSVRG